jgi:hypothetical protein
MMAVAPQGLGSNCHRLTPAQPDRGKPGEFFHSLPAHPYQLTPCSFGIGAVREVVANRRGIRALL